MSLREELLSSVPPGPLEGAETSIFPPGRLASGRGVRHVSGTFHDILVDSFCRTFFSPSKTAVSRSGELRSSVGYIGLMRTDSADRPAVFGQNARTIRSVARARPSRLVCVCVAGSFLVNFVRKTGFFTKLRFINWVNFISICSSTNELDCDPVRLVRKPYFEVLLGVFVSQIRTKACC